MRTFAQKHNRPQKPISSSLARPDMATRGRVHREHPLLSWRRAPGAQAVQRMLQTHGEELNSGLTGTASPRVGHDCSRTAIHPPVVGAIQTKWQINKPGDEYAQQADRISAQVMRRPEPQLQRACACGGGCPTGRSQTEHPSHNTARLQTKHGRGNDADVREAPPAVNDVVRSPDQPLDAGTRAFMAPRFGHDFSRVRVHLDAKAARSADAVNARLRRRQRHRLWPRRVRARNSARPIADRDGDRVALHGCGQEAAEPRCHAA
jgi:hypothetical protein